MSLKLIRLIRISRIQLLLEYHLPILQVAQLVPVIRRHIEPRVCEHLLRSGPFVRKPLEHRVHKSRQHLRLPRLHPILLLQQAFQRAELEPLNSAERRVRILLLEELPVLLSGLCELLRHRAHELHHLGQLVVGFGVLRAFARLEEEVAGDELEDHAGERPDVRARVVVDAEEDFWRSVLTRLNSLGEVVVGPTTVA